jgi:hypothetical protein
MRATAIELEIDGVNNENLHFRPMERRIRGRLDFTRVKEPMAMVESSKWPKPIPSQRFGIDAEGIGYLIEPLQDAENAVLKEKIEKQGQKLEPAMQTFENADLPTWYFWIKQAVESGIAKIVKGKLPEKFEGTPRKNFVTNTPPQSSNDKLAEALNRQSDLMEKMLTALAAKE